MFSLGLVSLAIAGCAVFFGLRKVFVALMPLAAALPELLVGVGLACNGLALMTDGAHTARSGVASSLAALTLGAAALIVLYVKAPSVPAAKHLRALNGGPLANAAPLRADEVAAVDASRGAADAATAAEAIEGRLHDALGTWELPTPTPEQDRPFRGLYRPLRERFEPLYDRLAARLSGRRELEDVPSEEKQSTFLSVSAPKTVGRGEPAFCLPETGR